MIELLDQNTTEQSNTKANINSLAIVLSMEASAMFSITVWEFKLVPSFNINGRRYYWESNRINSNLRHAGLSYYWEPNCNIIFKTSFMKSFSLKQVQVHAAAVDQYSRIN
jgi:hypothetical protein